MISTSDRGDYELETGGNFDEVMQEMQADRYIDKDNCLDF
jgi:hypothetical protein